MIQGKKCNTQNGISNDGKEPQIKVDIIIESSSNDNRECRSQSKSEEADAAAKKKQEIEAARNSKKQAMNRMRNNVKDTLFKGISKKINAEEVAQATEQAKQKASDKIDVDNIPFLKSKKENDGSDKSQIQSIQLSSELRESVEFDQMNEAANSIPSNSRSKPNSLWSVIIEEKEPPYSLNSSTQSSIINQTRIFEENYEFVGEKLGEGCHGDVRKCLHKKTKQPYAVKMIRNGDTEIILSAITSFKIAKNLNHPSIIKPKELFINRETEKIFYVMEYCEYKSLQEHIENIWDLSQNKKDKLKTRENLEIGEEDDENKQLNSQKKRNSNSLLKAYQNSNQNNQVYNKKKFKKAKTDINPFNDELNLPKSDDPQCKKQQSAFVQGSLKDDEEVSVNFFDKQALEEGIHNLQLQQMKHTPSEKSLNAWKVETAKKILKEILIAVSYLHSEGICHRDLKPDNILISSDLQNVKIIDFEISKQFKYFRPNKSVVKQCEMWTRTGTQDFMSPEMFESSGYTEAVDIWAIGVIAYLLLSGRLPFDQEYISDKIESIRSGSYNTEYIKDIEEVPKDFVRRMLKREPSERLTADSALSHPWFLVNSEQDMRARNDINKQQNLNLNKSLHLNHFFSPIATDKFYEGQPQPMLKINQSTILSNKGFNYGMRNEQKQKGQNNNSKYDLQSSSSNPNRSGVMQFQKLETNQFDYGERKTDKTSETKNNKVVNKEINAFSFENENKDYKINQAPQSLMLGESFSVGQNNNPKFEGFKYSVDEDDIFMNAQLQEKKKEEFQKMVLEFKQQMKINSEKTDIFQTDYIHINQKQKAHPQVSQLRLKLLQQKKEQENHQAALQLVPSSLSLSQQLQSHLQQSTQQNLSNNPTSIQQSPPSMNLNLTSNISHSSQNVVPNAILTSSTESGIKINTQQTEGQELQMQVSPNALAGQINRSKSNTNDFKEKSSDSEEQNERRAKKLSEDFTSSCVFQKPLEKEIQMLSSQNNKHGNPLLFASQFLIKQNKQLLSSSVYFSKQFADNDATAAESNKQALQPLSVEEKLQLKTKKHSLLNFFADDAKRLSEIKEKEIEGTNHNINTNTNNTNHNNNKNNVFNNKVNSSIPFIKQISSDDNEDDEQLSFEIKQVVSDQSSLNQSLKLSMNGSEILQDLNKSNINKSQKSSTHPFTPKQNEEESLEKIKITKSTSLRK